MDQKKLQQQIAYYYSKLPLDAQNMFSSMKWLETLKVISIKYALNDKQIETLGTETTLVLLGIIHPEDYEETLVNELDLSIESVEKIFIEINESVLKPIRRELTRIFIENTENELMPNWNQNVDFILSGGDYAVFAEQNSPLEESPAGGGGQNSSTPSLRATPQEGNGNQILGTARKLEDIKSKFTI